MKLTSIVLPLSCSFFIGQIYADLDADSLDKSDDKLNDLSLIELRGIVPTEVNDKSKNDMKESQVPAAPFSQSLATYTINFLALCEGLDWTDDQGKQWHHTFSKAMCDLHSGNNRLVKVSCHAEYKRRGPRAIWRRGRMRSLSYECPENTVCRRLGWLHGPGEPRREEIACVDDTDVRTDLVTPANSHADPNVPDVYCGLSLALPGTQFTVNPGIKSIDIVLTEEARFKDGSPYPAPMIYIRDKTSWRGFDRVFRRDASVASTQLTLTAINGKFYTRTFEFCMQLLPGLTSSAVTFTYSWFQITSRHGRIPGQFISRQEKYNETTVE